ncbi:MAG: hypothetical protein AB1696_00090 [Planctomycetota bacterium]
MTNIYLELTREFNAGRLRAIISSGQAVVLHRLAVMSKDGDWILREDKSALAHILSVLAQHGARYRFGAPLDVRWMRGGWSAHFEFRGDRLRVRTDFVTRPPRVSEKELADLWIAQEGCDPPLVDARLLAEIKKTNREKDYAIIGELARTMLEMRDRILYSRSARDLIALAQAHPDLVSELAAKRPLLEKVSQGRDALEEALDAERRQLMRANEARLQRYQQAAETWAGMWPDIDRETRNQSLPEAHRIITARAEEALPFEVKGAQTW